MDPKRVNEFGTSGEDSTPGTGTEGSGTGDHNEDEQDSKSAMDKKQD